MEIDDEACGECDESDNEFEIYIPVRENKYGASRAHGRAEHCGAGCSCGVNTSNGFGAFEEDIDGLDAEAGEESHRSPDPWAAWNGGQEETLAAKFEREQLSWKSSTPSSK